MASLSCSTVAVDEMVMESLRSEGPLIERVKSDDDDDDDDVSSAMFDLVRKGMCRCLYRDEGEYGSD